MYFYKPCVSQCCILKHCGAATGRWPCLIIFLSGFLYHRHFCTAKITLHFPFSYYLIITNGVFVSQAITVCVLVNGAVVWSLDPYACRLLWHRGGLSLTQLFTNATSVSAPSIITGKQHSAHRLIHRQAISFILPSTQNAWSGEHWSSKAGGTSEHIHRVPCTHTPLVIGDYNIVLWTAHGKKLTRQKVAKL